MVESLPDTGTEPKPSGGGPGENKVTLARVCVQVVAGGAWRSGLYRVNRGEPSESWAAMVTLITASELFNAQ